MRKYMPIIESSAILFFLGFMMTFMGATIQSVIICDTILWLVLLAFTLSCVYLKKLNYSGYANIATWKYIRNLILYCVAIAVGNVLGYLTV